MPRKKTDDVVSVDLSVDKTLRPSDTSLDRAVIKVEEKPIVDEIKVEEVKVEPKIEEKVIVKTEEIKVDPPIVSQSGRAGNNSVSFVRPIRPVQPPRPQVHYNPPVQTPSEPIIGVLEVMSDNQGFIRPHFSPTFKDAFIGSMQIKRYGLRAGDMVEGLAKAPKENEKYWAMTRIDKINGMELEKAFRRPDFKDLVPIYPQKQVKLETESDIISTRIIDLFSPIGFGQRGMVVSPPKAGKTTLLKEIAAGVSINYPEAHLMAVLVGERPEEVTDMQRFIKGEVIASSFDQKPEEQTRAAEIAMERAKRLVELGKDVFIVFDSITRLARAYNLAIPTSGRTLSGGFDPAALYPSKRFFGAARKIENGGSLTIIGTALVDTGSKMDDLIFEEFKGTGNMELRLERNLAERRIFPAFDVLKSGTRREDLLLDPAALAKIISIRRMFDALGEKNDAAEMIIEQMTKTKNNAEFMAKIGKK